MPSKSTAKARRKALPKLPDGAESAQHNSLEAVSSRRKKSKPTRRTSGPGLAPWWSQAVVTLTALFFGLIRVRLLSFPLERDEGEYAYGGQLIMHAVAPYRYCYSMKLPGTAAAYALLTSVFGQTAVGVHLGLLLVNSTTIVLVYLLSRRLFGNLAGVVASASFALLSLEPTVLGFAGHATQFVILPAVGGIIILLKAIEKGRPHLFFWSGLALGLAFLMKQPGIFFVLFAAFYLAYSEWMRGLQRRQLVSRVLLLAVGAVLPFALTCLVMFRAGVFSRFWFWTFSYASQYGNIVTFSKGVEYFWGTASQVVAPAAPVWIIAAMGIGAVLWRPKTGIHRIFVLGFLVFSFAAVCPGLYFRKHYFVLLLPAASLLCGVAVSRATSMMQESFKSPTLRLVPSVLFAAALGISVFHDSAFFFETDPVAACYDLYGNNPFPEAPKIAEFIRSRSAPEDRIAVFGSEPEIYFYSQRRSATGYVYTYPLMENQPFAADMQREMESEIESAKPRFMVFIDVPTSWLVHTDSDTRIVSWFEQYAKSQYQLVGAIDLLGQETEFKWDSDARSYKPRSPFMVLVFQKT